MRVGKVDVGNEVGVIAIFERGAGTPSVPMTIGDLGTAQVRFPVEPADAAAVRRSVELRDFEKTVRQPIQTHSVFDGTR